jgi:hypothetical protein
MKGKVGCAMQLSQESRNEADMTSMQKKRGLMHELLNLLDFCESAIELVVCPGIRTYTSKAADAVA